MKRLSIRLWSRYSARPRSSATWLYGVTPLWFVLENHARLAARRGRRAKPAQPALTNRAAIYFTLMDTFEACRNRYFVPSYCPYWRIRSYLAKQGQVLIRSSRLPFSRRF